MGFRNQAQLSDVCELIVDCPHSSAKDEGMGYPLIRTPNIGPGYLDLSSVHRVSRDVYIKRNTRATPQPGDIILAREAPAGNAGIVLEGQEVCLGQRTVLIRPDRAVADPLFMNYYLNAPQQRQHLLNVANGATVSHINMSSIRSLPVQLPSMIRQKQIAQILGSLDDLIRCGHRTNGYLAELVRTEFDYRFGSETPTTNLGDVMTILTQSLKPSACTGEIWEHYSIPAFDENHRPVFEPADEIKSNKYVIDNNCILISKLNPSAKRLWLPCCTSKRPVCSTEFIVYKPKRPEYKSFYYAAVDSPAFTDFLLAHVTGSTGSRQRTQPKATLNYPMPNPSVEEIEDFCEFADPVIAKWQLNEQESAQLEHLRNALLPKLMSSEIDVSQVELPTQPNNHIATVC